MIEININGLRSLESMSLKLCSTRRSFSITNLKSLTCFSLDDSRINTIDDNIITLFNLLPNLETLYLEGNFSYFNLDNLVNLKRLTLAGKIGHDFNMEIFKNLCNQLEELTLSFKNFDDRTFLQLFKGYHFSNLKKLIFRESYVKRVDKNFIDRFPIIERLWIVLCDLEIIDDNAFSNVKHLYYIDFSNNRISFIPKNAFSNLKNLKTLYLISNGLNNLDREYIGVGNSVEIYL